MLKMATYAASSLESSMGKDADCERIFKRFTYKCLQIIVQSRIDQSSLQGRLRDYSTDNFSINIPDNTSIEEQIRNSLEGIKSFPIKDRSVCVEISLKTSDGDFMFLETWDISFSLSSLDMSACKAQHIYTRMGLTLKSLLSATRATPAYRLAKNQGEKGGGYRLNYRFYLGPPKTHMLGEDFKTSRAGAVPSGFGLLSINVSYRTKLLLSPDTTAPTASVMQVTDDHFMKEYKTKHSHSHSAFSDPKPCHPASQRKPSLSSPENQAAGTYHYTVSPSSQGTDEDMASKLSAECSVPWPLSSILNIDELPQPAVGAFSVQRPNAVKVEDNDLPFEGLMKRSMMARMEQKQRQELNKRGGEDSGFERSNELRQHGRNEEEKENVNVFNRLSENLPSLEEDYVIVDPPFASDDDPRDVKSFLGVMFRAPHLYDVSDVPQPTVDDYLMDVGEMVNRLEEDMPVLDEFCRSVIDFNSVEDEDTATMFS